MLGVLPVQALPRGSQHRSMGEPAAGCILPRAPVFHSPGFWCSHLPKQVEDYATHGHNTASCCLPPGDIAKEAAWQESPCPSLGADLHHAKRSPCDPADRWPPHGAEHGQHRKQGKHPAKSPLNCILGSGGGHCMQLQRAGRSRRERLPLCSALAHGASPMDGVATPRDMQG